jgi:hypothetical protein
MTASHIMMGTELSSEMTFMPNISQTLRNVLNNTGIMTCVYNLKAPLFSDWNNNLT